MHRDWLTFKWIFSVSRHLNGFHRKNDENFETEVHASHIVQMLGISVRMSH